MKKIITLLLFFCGFFYTPVLFGTTQFEVINKTLQPIELIRDTYIKYSLFPANIVEYNIIDPDLSSFIYNNDILSIGSTLNISIVEKNIDCSWVTILGMKMSHGIVVDVKINEKVAGEFCVNKCSVVDPIYHGKIEIFKDANKRYNLKFYNTGWWHNDSVAANELQVDL